MTLPLHRKTLRTGGAAVAMITVMLLLSLVVLGLLTSSARRPMLGQREVEGDRAFYAADSALQLAIRELSLNLDEDGDGIIGSVTQPSDAIFGGTAMSVTREDAGGEVVLRAIGTDNPVSRHLRIRSTLSGGGGAGNESAYPGLVTRLHPVNFAPSQISQIPWNDTPHAVSTAHLIDWPGVRSNSNPFWSFGQNTNWGARFTGLIRIDQPGIWWFRTRSDDGSLLWIGEQLVVGNDGLHGMRTRSGSIELEAGTHPFEIRFFERAGAHGLIASWRPPGENWQVIPPSALLHTSAHLNALPPLLVAHERLTLNGRGSSQSCTITGGINGAVVQTNATAPQSVSVTRGTIFGGVRVGPGGDPASVISLGHNGNITGQTSAALSEAVALRIVSPPPGLPSNSGSWNLLDGGTHVQASNFRLNSLRIRDTTFRIDGHVTGYIGGTLELEGTGRILISAGSTLHLQVGGEIRAGDNAKIEVVGDNPDRVQLEIVGNHRFFIRQRAEITARVIAPNAEIRFESGAPPNRGHLRGSLIARIVELNDMASIHLVRSTTTTDDMDGPAMMTLIGFDQIDSSPDAP